MGAVCRTIVPCVTCILLVSVMVGSVGARPAHSAGTAWEVTGVKRNILQDGFNLEKRPRAVEALRTGAAQCNESSQCYPPGIADVPSDLISCDVYHQCLCKDCFKRGHNGVCVDSDEVCEDYYYSSRRKECVDHRRSQLTAFLLSFFFSPVGAANFYIGQNGLGAGQLVILLLLIVASYGLCGIPLCMAGCLTHDDVKSAVAFLAVGMAIILVVLVCVIGLWAWWLSDLIIFATNERDAGNGCSLISDF